MCELWLKLITFLGTQLLQGLVEGNCSNVDLGNHVCLWRTLICTTVPTNVIHMYLTTRLLYGEKSDHTLLQMFNVTHNCNIKSVVCHETVSAVAKTFQIISQMTWIIGCLWLQRSRECTVTSQITGLQLFRFRKQIQACVTGHLWSKFTASMWISLTKDTLYRICFHVIMYTW